jgi:hypothetical protein
MKKCLCMPERPASGLREAEEDNLVAEICRYMGVSERTFYPRKKKLQGMRVAEMRRLGSLEEDPP